MSDDMFTYRIDDIDIVHEYNCFDKRTGSYRDATNLERTQRDQIVRLKADLAAHREIAEALAALNPQLHEIDGGVCCSYCSRYERLGVIDHAPDCLWLKAKALTGKEADDDNPGG